MSSRQRREVVRRRRDAIVEDWAEVTRQELGRELGGVTIMIIRDGPIVG